MALTNLQALDIVIGCVKGVTTRAPSPNETLKAGGITDEPRLSAFKSLVVADPDVGVARHNHRIAPSSLNGVSIDDTAQATADVVRANATPIGAAERAPAAPRTTVPPGPRKRKTAAGTGKAEKRTKKARKKARSR